MLTKRIITPERMDDPAVDPRELERALRFLRFVNGPIGGGAAAAIVPLARWTRSWPKGATIRIIDIGTGAADVPIAIVAWAKRNNLRVRITAVDLHETTLAIAREAIAPHPEIELMRWDARRLMDAFEPGAFDFAHAGLFLHHLPDIEVMTVLRIMDRLTASRGGESGWAGGMIWNDLIRSPVAKLLVRAATAMPGVPEIARHDARVSVQAGFTRREAIDLAKRTGWETIRYCRHRLYRFVLTGTKRA